MTESCTLAHLLRNTTLASLEIPFNIFQTILFLSKVVITRVFDILQCGNFNVLVFLNSNGTTQVENRRNSSPHKPSYRQKDSEVQD